MKHTPDEAVIFAHLCQVDTPNYDIAEAVRRQRAATPAPRRKLPRVGLLVACLVLALTLGAAAVAGISAVWRDFFVSPIPSAAVTALGVSQTAGEYTLTIEDAIVDDNGAILLLALTRADGGEIDPEAALRTNSMGVHLQVEGKGFGGSIGSAHIPSGDKKTVYYCFETRNQAMRESLLGKTLTFQADGVAIQLREPDRFYQLRGEPVDLSPLAGVEQGAIIETGHWEREVEVALDSALEAQAVSIPLQGPLAAEFPGGAIRGALMTSDGLCIALSYESYVRNGDRICTEVDAEALVDRRTGERYDLVNGNGWERSDGRVMLYHWQDCPLTLEDLPYLELEVSYAVDRILSDLPFSIDFTADSSSAVSLPLSGTETVDGVELHPAELRLSALGLTIYWNDSMDTAHVIYTSELAPLITLKDGSTLQTQWRGGYGGGDGSCAVSFQAKDADGNRIFFDPDQIASVTFGTRVIPVEGQ